jgi:hypothetical protein
MGAWQPAAAFAGNRDALHALVVDCDQPHAHTRKCPSRKVEKVIELPRTRAGTGALASPTSHMRQ